MNNAKVFLWIIGLTFFFGGLTVLYITLSANGIIPKFETNQDLIDENEELKDQVDDLESQIKDQEGLNWFFVALLVPMGIGALFLVFISMNKNIGTYMTFENAQKIAIKYMVEKEKWRTDPRDTLPGEDCIVRVNNRQCQKIEGDKDTKYYLFEFSNHKLLSGATSPNHLTITVMLRSNQGGGLPEIYFGQNIDHVMKVNKLEIQKSLEHSSLTQLEDFSNVANIVDKVRGEL